MLTMGADESEDNKLIRELLIEEQLHTECWLSIHALIGIEGFSWYKAFIFAGGF